MALPAAGGKQGPSQSFQDSSLKGVSHLQQPKTGSTKVLGLFFFAEDTVKSSSSFIITESIK